MTKLYSKKTAYGLTPPFINIDSPTIKLLYDPTFQDKYEVGQMAINTTTNTVWMLTSYLNGLPVWTELDNGGGAGVLVWTIEAGALITLTNNHGYTLTNPGPVTMTLPVVSPLGSLIEIQGGAGQWRINQGAGQQLRGCGLASTLGAAGFTTSQTANLNMTLRTVVADTIFEVFGTNGSFATH
jgi:hypothetical protein